MLCKFSWCYIDNVSLEFLGSEICERFGESFSEAGTEHDDKLRDRVSKRSSITPRVFVRVSLKSDVGRSKYILQCPGYLRGRIREGVTDLVLVVEVKPQPWVAELGQELC
jgi:hypothetical protein